MNEQLNYYFSSTLENLDVKFGSFLHENLRIAYASIASNKLRAVLTMAIIAIGILSLVGIVTAIESIKGSITDSFSALGANSFTISNRTITAQGGPDGRRNRNQAQISYDQAREFQERFTVPSTVSLSMNVSGSAIIKRGSVKTNPNVRLYGGNENALKNSGDNLAEGRNFSQIEVSGGRSVAIIGSDVARVLFPDDDPINQQISTGGASFTVVGVLAAKGASMGRSEDLRMIIPITAARALFAIPYPNVSIAVTPDQPEWMDLAASEAEGVFRTIRRLSASDDSDFSINRSDSFANMMIENLAMVTMAASLIGLITLLGAAVGLMNIMLVSVGERTREIGTRMALGAKPRVIEQQFLFESILISQMGGAAGIVLGILCGNLISLLTGGAFVIPWGWLVLGVALCLLVGICSGYLPARKAAGLDPVEALRYE